MTEPSDLPRPVPLGDPPRSVSLLARASVLAGSELFGQFGWSWLALTGLFLWVFAGDSELVTWIEMRGPLARTHGTVTDVHETHAEENESPIYATAFQYEAGGQLHSDESFALDRPHAPGDRVAVEYRVADPSASRIVGMRRRRFDLAAGFVLLFPIVGVVLVVRSTRHGLRALCLLRHGRVGYGRLLHKTRTGASIGNEHVQELTYELAVRVEPTLRGYRVSGRAETRRYRITAEAADTTALEDEALEPLLYDPEDPGVGVLLDSLPATLILDGGVRGGSPRLLVAPCLALAVNAIGLALTLAR